MVENSAEITTRILTNYVASLKAKPKNILVTIYACSLNFSWELMEDVMKEVTLGGLWQV